MLLTGEVWTCDGRRPLAGAVYVEGGRVLDVGAAEDLRARYPGAEKAAFERITPGLHDAHVHPVYWGQSLEALDLRDERDPRLVAASVRSRAAQMAPGAWIRGGGYVFDTYPVGDLLNRAAPENPVYLESRDLHSAWVNQRALEMAGIDEATPDPEAGRIVRDASGRPTGYLLERAVRLVADKLPPPTKADLLRGLADLAGRGYVAVHAMGELPPEATQWVRELANADALPLRLAWVLPKGIWRSYTPEKIGEQLHVFGVKYFADGALTSRTAWMKDEYPAGGYGMPLDDPRSYDEETAAVLAAGLQPVWHAIGTRAVHELLNLLDRLEARGLPARRNLRIEHAQHVANEDLARLAGLTISAQPLHARDDRETVARLLGEQEKTSYRWREIHDLPGVRLLFGSDAPVAVPDAAAGIAVAGRHPLAAERSLAEREALRAYVHTPAVALGWNEEAEPWGVIAPGSRATLTLWENGKPAARLWRGQIEPTVLNEQLGAKSNV